MGLQVSLEKVMATDQGKNVKQVEAQSKPVHSTTSTGTTQHAVLPEVHFTSYYQKTHSYDLGL